MLCIERLKYLYEINLKGAEDEKMEIKLFTDLYFECMKFFKHFGSALFIAFRDMEMKANMILKN